MLILTKLNKSTPSLTEEGSSRIQCQTTAAGAIGATAATDTSAHSSRRSRRTGCRTGGCRCAARLCAGMQGSTRVEGGHGVSGRARCLRGRCAGQRCGASRVGVVLGGASGESLPDLAGRRRRRPRTSCHLLGGAAVESTPCTSSVPALRVKA